MRFWLRPESSWARAHGIFTSTLGRNATFWSRFRLWKARRAGTSLRSSGYERTDRIELSGPPDGRLDGLCQFEKFYSSREFFFCPNLFARPPKPIKLRVDHPPAPSHACASHLRARACRSPLAAPRHPRSQAPVCHAAGFASRISLLIGRAGDASPVGAHSGPEARHQTHARPLTASKSFAQSKYPRFFGRAA